MLKIAIPEVHVSSARAAREFYSTMLGFACTFSWRADETREDPCYMVFVRDNARLHVTSFRDGALGGSVYLYVDDVDALHAEFTTKGIEKLDPVVDQPWETREFAVTDPDQNKLRFGKDMSVHSD